MFEAKQLIIASSYQMFERTYGRGGLADDSAVQHPLLIHAPNQASLQPHGAHRGEQPHGSSYSRKRFDWTGAPAWQPFQRVLRFAHMTLGSQPSHRPILSPSSSSAAAVEIFRPCNPTARTYTTSSPSLARERNASGSMDLYRAVFVLGLLISPLTVTAQTTCDTGYIGDCVSSAIVNACGDLTETACICGTSGRAEIGTIAGSCLISHCPLTEILAIGNYGFSACDEWLSTHTLSTTGAGQAPATTTSSLPSSMSFNPSTSASARQMSIASSPTASTSQLAATTPSSTSAVATTTHLSLGAEVGIGVGAFVLLCVLILSFVLWLRYRRSKRRPSSSHASLSAHALRPSGNLYELADKSSVHELQTGANIHELPDKAVELHDEPVVEIPLRELAGFQFPFQKRADSPVEADSRSARAGMPRGRQAGTEATAFDFENQKVLLTPNLRSTSKGSASPSRSLRQRNVDI